MRVRMTCPITGLRDGQPWPPRGGEIVVPDAEGRDLCTAGLAVPVAEPAPVERAEAPAPERRARARKAG